MYLTRSCSSYLKEEIDTEGELEGGRMLLRREKRLVKRVLGRVPHLTMPLAAPQ